MGKIIVIGSSNTDMVVSADRLPRPGETILGGRFIMSHGGKGANQALAAGRLGGDVTFISCVGEDMFGRDALDSLSREGVDVSLSQRIQGSPSGVALINVGQEAQNTIVVAPGANDLLTPSMVERAAPLMDDQSIVLMQLEVPMASVAHAARLARSRSSRVILNPAPAAVLPPDMYENLDAIIPNETEAELLTGIRVETPADAAAAAEVLLERGVPLVIITMGHRGAYVRTRKQELMVPAFKVQPVDTTAAGDTFCGAFCVALSRGLPLEKAVLFANRCSSISVTRMGAQSSAPYLNEVEAYLG